MGRPRIHDVQEFDGVAYYKKPEGYYKSDWKKHGGKLLHQVVWEHHHNRRVPKGYCVHHLNGEKGDNRPENLCLLAASKHARQHAVKNLQEIPERMLHGIIAAQEAAKKWHGSPVGREWHSKHGKEIWRDREKKQFTCVVCGKQYWTYPQSRKRGFCSPACQQRMRRKEHSTSRKRKSS